MGTLSGIGHPLFFLPGTMKATSSATLGDRDRRAAWSATGRGNDPSIPESLLGKGWGPRPKDNPTREPRNGFGVLSPPLSRLRRNLVVSPCEATDPSHRCGDRCFWPVASRHEQRAALNHLSQPLGRATPETTVSLPEIKVVTRILASLSRNIEILARRAHHNFV
jgi:hypothetical protein